MQSAEEVVRASPNASGLSQKFPPNLYQRLILGNQVLAQLMTKWYIASQSALSPVCTAPSGASQKDQLVVQDS